MLCGDYLVLLNNDVVVTDGWLDQLIALANARGRSTAEHAEGREEDGHCERFCGDKPTAPPAPAL